MTWRKFYSRGKTEQSSAPSPVWTPITGVSSTSRYKSAPATSSMRASFIIAILSEAPAPPITRIHLC